MTWSQADEMATERQALSQTGRPGVTIEAIITPSGSKHKGSSQTVTAEPSSWPMMAATEDHSNKGNSPDPSQEQQKGQIKNLSRIFALSKSNTNHNFHSQNNSRPLELEEEEITEDATVQYMESTYKKDKQNLMYVVKSGTAGGLAGCVAKTLIAPLDRVKILFQTGNPLFVKYTHKWNGLYEALKYIRSSEGGTGLFRGHSATLLRIFPYAGVKFIVYEQIRAQLIPSRDYETNLRRMLSGSLSGVCSVFCTYPLDVLRVRLAYESKVEPGHTPDRMRGRLWQAAKKIYHEPHAAHLPPISNFYHGFLPTVMGMIPYAGVSFWAHDTAHDIMRAKPLRHYAVDYDHPKANQLRVWAQLTAGGIAGLCAQTAAYPLEVVRRRIQVGGATGEYRRIMPTVRHIYAQSGFRGFFVGLTIGYLKVVPMFACSFFVYERAKTFLNL